MTVGDRGGLAIVELIFYVAALPVSLLVANKHGFGRSAGWFFLIILCLMRIAGAIAELVAINTLQTGAFIAAAILANVGFSTLLAALLGILKRLNEGMQSHRVPPRVFALFLLLILVGLIVGIVGGTSVYSSSPSNPPSSGAYNELHASAIVLVVAFILLIGAIAWTFAFMQFTIKSDRILLYAAAASIPFLIIRIIFNVLQTYQVDNSRFSSVMGSVAIYAVMAILMEFFVVLIYLAAGWKAPKIDREQVKVGLWNSNDQSQKAASIEMGAHSQPHAQQQSGTV